MIIRSAEYMENGMPTLDMLGSVIAEHAQELPRLRRLEAYYGANSDILRRTRAPGLPNNKIAHPFARYITSVATGYLVGNPATYAVTGEGAALEDILDAYSRCTVASVDVENARNASIYGRGVEYIHVPLATPDAAQGGILPRVCALKPTQAFVVYDDTHESNPLFGVYYAPHAGETGRTDGYRIWVMGRERIAQYSAANLSTASFAPISEMEHYFGGVPLVEYWNDEDERGDFEWVIPLIDAYDKLESDRVNDKEQFVDRLLVLYGCTMEADECGRSPAQQLREDKALCVPEGGSAEYLSCAMDEGGAEVLRAALVEDIHKMSMVPDLSDKNFAQNASGVAMRYKLFGLENLINVKQQWFVEGLRARLRLFAHFMQVRGAPALDVDQVRIELTRSLPANVLELAQIAQMADAAGAASTETRVRLLHSADGWTEEQVQTEARRIDLERGTRIEEDVALGDLERDVPTETDDADAARRDSPERDAK